MVTDLVTTKEAAALLGRSVSTVHRYVEVGRLSHAVRIDGLRGPKFFRRADVEALGAELAKTGAEPSGEAA